MSEVADLVGLISTSTGQQRAAASADLAERIWASKVGDDELVSLLTHSNRFVRGSVAWAVADKNGPIAGVRWLAEHGVKDEYERVRFWAVHCASEMPEARRLVSPDDVKTLCRDPCDDVRNASIKLWREAGKTDGS